MEGLTVGRMVHYVLSNRDVVDVKNIGEHRAAVVVRTFDDVHRDALANLVVFMDGLNDVSSEVFKEGSILWRTSVGFTVECAPGTYHWIERA